MMKIILFLVLLNCIAFIGAADECPNINIGNNLAEVEKDLSFKIYNTPIEGSDENTEKAIDELRSLAESGNVYQRHIAYTVAIWLSAFIGNLNEASNFCPLAQLINASVSKDPDQLRSALDAAGGFEKVLSLYRQQNSIDASGCFSTPIIKDLPRKSCYENGYAYEIDVLWKRRESVLPSGFSDIVHSLYSSDLIINKYLALLISYCITYEIEILIDKYPLAVSLQATSLQFSCKIPQCCCKIRLNVLEIFSVDTAYASKDILDSLKPACVCPDTNITVDDYEAVQNNITIEILDDMPSELSLTGESVLDTLIEMADSEKPKYRGIAFLTSIIYKVLVSDIEGAPSLCGFADVINSTVMYEHNTNKSNLINALDSVKILVEYIYYYNKILSISASACENETPIIKPVIKAVSGCYNEGYAYNIKQLWSIQSKKIPPGLGYKVKELYYSNDERERLLALVLSYVICPSSLDAWTTYDPAIAFQAFSYTVSKPIPKCCCGNRLNAIAEISQTSISRSKKLCDEIKAFYCTN